jgi:hypothetical protein
MLTSMLPDLDVLDYLELFNSTVRVSELLKVSQSTCSRRYRLLSDQLQLNFDRVDGGYRALSNADLLNLFRCAAQRLRLRKQELRCVNTLPCIAPQQASTLGALLPWEAARGNGVLGALEKRLVDVWLTGLLSLSGQVKLPLEEISPGPLDLQAGLQAIPLFRTTLCVVARDDHPLVERNNVSPADLALYPSSGGLLHLAQDPSAQSADPQGWLACIRDGRSLACVSSHLLPELQQRHRLVQLPYTLNRHDVGALIAHRDLLFDQAFPEILRRFLGELRQAPALSHPSLIWLV